MNLSKDQLKQVSVVQPAIQSAYKSTLKLITEHDQYFTVEELQVISDTIDLLFRHRRNIESTSFKIQARTKKMQPIIESAVSGLFKTETDLHAAKRRLQLRLEAHQFNQNQLQKLGWGRDKIELNEPFPQSEVDAMEAEISRLEAEHHQINLFIQSAPLWDTDLLAGTRFEQETVKEAA